MNDTIEERDQYEWGGYKDNVKPLFSIYCLWFYRRNYPELAEVELFHIFVQV